MCRDLKEVWHSPTVLTDVNSEGVNVESAFTLYLLHKGAVILHTPIGYYTVHSKNKAGCECCQPIDNVEIEHVSRNGR